MPSYLIEGYLSRSRTDELYAAAARLRRAAEALSAEGVQVRHVRSSFLPADELFLHVLEAESAEAAGAATKRAGISPERMTTEEVAP
jgi:predicted TIM-barrel fold metal-dependent hydrolase